MVGQVVWAVVVAVFLVTVAVGWAVHGSALISGRLKPSQQPAVAAPAPTELLRFLSQYRILFASALLLAFSLLFLVRSLDRGLPLMGAMALAFTYALLSATATGFIVWVRAQQNTDRSRTQRAVRSTHAAWVGVGIGALAVLYLVMDVVTTLTTLTA